MKRIGENPPARHPDRPIADALHPWCIARVKSRQEKILADELAALQIEYYMPLVTKISNRNDNNKTRKSILPLFPGYICVAAPRVRYLDIYNTGRIASFIEIKDQKMFTMQLSWIYEAIGHGAQLEPVTELPKQGTCVQVQYGPLKGMQGIVMRYKNRTKLILSVDGMGRAAMVVDNAMVRPISEEFV